jgi:hypothetical protein
VSLNLTYYTVTGIRIASQFVEDYLDQPDIEKKFKNDVSEVN